MPTITENIYHYYRPKEINKSIEVVNPYYCPIMSLPLHNYPYNLPMS